MGIVAKALLSLTAGSLCGWWLLVGFCNLPVPSVSNVCGHNAYIWLPLAIPLGIYAVWLLIGCVFQACRASHATKKSGRNNA
jgi:hypothetical protein